ncbi:hypothetical protein BS47DRAFT_312001 [Hydnum rufescens UP504]|uniref:Uncharacterized protein n=1 Tax=Hydnum rufescens UP504 TaxID=1448309 RepID=A0A9P6DLX8_9AGAM|nr:hypothetical protein BS47DRAFT_312001 [Hydnum rufescens UP504]
MEPVRDPLRALAALSPEQITYLLSLAGQQPAPSPSLQLTQPMIPHGHADLIRHHLTPNASSASSLGAIPGVPSLSDGRTMPSPPTLAPPPGSSPLLAPNPTTAPAVDGLGRLLIPGVHFASPDLPASGMPVPHEIRPSGAAPSHAIMSGGLMRHPPQYPTLYQYGPLPFGPLEPSPPVESPSQVLPYNGFAHPLAGWPLVQPGLRGETGIPGSQGYGSTWERISPATPHSQ